MGPPLLLSSMTSTDDSGAPSFGGNGHHSAVAGGISSGSSPGDGSAVVSMVVADGATGTIGTSSQNIPAVEDAARLRAIEDVRCSQTVWDEPMGDDVRQGRPTGPSIYHSCKGHQKIHKVEELARNPEVEPVLLLIQDNRGPIRRGRSIA